MVEALGLRPSICESFRMQLSARSPVFFRLLTGDDGDGFLGDAHILQDARNALDHFLLVFQSHARLNYHLHYRQQHRLSDKDTFRDD